MSDLNELSGIVRTGVEKPSPERKALFFEEYNRKKEVVISLLSPMVLLRFPLSLFR